MKMGLWRLAGCAAAVLFLAVGAFGETVDEVHAKLNDAFARVGSYSAQTETIYNMTMSGIKLDGKQTGSTKWMRKGDKVLSRSEHESKMTRKYDDQVEVAHTSTLSICDGEYCYHYIQNSGTNNEDGTKMAAKQKADPAAMKDVLSVVNIQKVDHKLRLLADEEVDGEACYVIEARPRDGEGALVASTTLWFRKGDGILVKMIGRDDEERDAQTFVISDIELNEDFPADLFKFTAPEGVEVTDMTVEKKADGK